MENTLRPVVITGMNTRREAGFLLETTDIVKKEPPLTRRDARVGGGEHTATCHHNGDEDQEGSRLSFGDNKQERTTINTQLRGYIYNMPRSDSGQRRDARVDGGEHTATCHHNGDEIRRKAGFLLETAAAANYDGWRRSREDEVRIGKYAELSPLNTIYTIAHMWPLY